VARIFDGDNPASNYRKQVTAGLDIGWDPNPIGSRTMREESGQRPIRAEPKDTKDKIGNASFLAQGEFFRTLQEMSHDWMACATTEFELGLKLSNNLIAARSIPDAVSAYGEWWSEEMSARAEDARRMMSRGQRFMDSSNRWMSPSIAA
jgi:hypothetical protein